MSRESDVFDALLQQADRIDECEELIKAAVPLDNGRAEFISSLCRNLVSTAVVVRCAGRLIKNGN